MKHSARLLKLTVMALGSAFLVSSAQAAIGKAVVRAVRGSADYMQGSGWKAMRTGLVLKPGAVLRTGSESQVDLFLDQNGPVVRVTENTEMALDKLSFEETGADVVIETQLDLRSGRILGRVDKTSDASKYEVRTPMGVAGIRGTLYDISATGVLKVIKGTVVFAWTQDGQARTQVVNAGEIFVPTVGGVRPIDPAELDTLLRIFGEIDATVTQGMVVITPPLEPLVSPVTGSTTGSGEGSSGNGQGSSGGAGPE